jgi:hypothetical protein
MQHSAKPTISISPVFIAINELPDKLRKAVEAFIPEAKAEKYDTKKGAHGWCDIASGYFAKTLEKRGFSSKDYSLREYLFDPITKEEKRIAKEDRVLFPFNIEKCIKSGQYCNFHWVTKVGKFIVDWTARQFDESAPFPAIWIEE